MVKGILPVSNVTWGDTDLIHVFKMKYLPEFFE